MGDSILKGTTFELEVGLRLSQLGDIKVLFDVWVHSPSLKAMTQIDILVLTRWGNFCIEAKSYSHELSGSIEDYQWVGRTWRKNTHIINPIVQNTTHIRALTRAIYMSSKQMVHFDSIIVVPDSCRINSDAKIVMTVSQLLRFCARNEERSPKIYDHNGLAKIIEVIRRKKNDR